MLDYERQKRERDMKMMGCTIKILKNIYMQGLSFSQNIDSPNVSCLIRLDSKTCSVVGRAA